MIGAHVAQLLNESSGSFPLTSSMIQVIADHARKPVDDLVNGNRRKNGLTKMHNSDLLLQQKHTGKESRWENLVNHGASSSNSLRNLHGDSCSTRRSISSTATAELGMLPKTTNGCPCSGFSRVTSDPDIVLRIQQNKSSFHSSCNGREDGKADTRNHTFQLAVEPSRELRREVIARPNSDLELRIPQRVLSPCSTSGRAESRKELYIKKYGENHVLLEKLGSLSSELGKKQTTKNQLSTPELGDDDNAYKNKPRIPQRSPSDCSRNPCRPIEANDKKTSKDSEHRALVEKLGFLRSELGKYKTLPRPSSTPDLGDSSDRPVKRGPRRRRSSSTYNPRRHDKRRDKTKPRKKASDLPNKSKNDEEKEEIFLPGWEDILDEKPIVIKPFKKSGRRNSIPEKDNFSPFSFPHPSSFHKNLTFPTPSSFDKTPVFEVPLGSNLSEKVILGQPSTKTKLSSVQRKTQDLSTTAFSSSRWSAITF